MEVHQLKQQIQSFFSDGLVIIVGSGLSAAEGISGMPALAEYLNTHMSENICTEVLSNWQEISQLLVENVDLEAALSQIPPEPKVEEEIRRLTCELIEADEQKVINDALKGNRVLRLSSLLRHCIQSSAGIPIVTTNYDRLIELASYQAGLGVDSLFFGSEFGRLNDEVSHFAHCRGIKRRGKQPSLDFSDRTLILKPHGSLDWYQTNDGPLRSQMKLELPRLIITPGANKYEAGYASPFDKHREVSNQKIINAQRFIIIGYGFNDNHLQYHLVDSLKKGKPALVLTRSLSPTLSELLNGCSNLVCLYRHTNETAQQGTLMRKAQAKIFFPSIHWWDVDKMVNEVLTA